MTRIYGHSVGGTRFADKTPLNAPTNTAILSSVRTNGEAAYTAYNGGTTVERRFRHIKAVAEAINNLSKNLTLLYLSF